MTTTAQRVTAPFNDNSSEGAKTIPATFKAKDDKTYKLTTLSGNLTDNQKAQLAEAIALPTEKEPMWPYWATEISDLYGDQSKIAKGEDYVTIAQNDKGDVVGVKFGSYDAKNEAAYNGYTYLSEDLRSVGLGGTMTKYAEQQVNAAVHAKGQRVMSWGLEAQYPRDIDTANLQTARPFDIDPFARLKFWEHMGYALVPITTTYPHEPAEHLLANIRGGVEKIFSTNDFERDVSMFKPGPDAHGDRKLAAAAAGAHVADESYAEYYNNIRLAGILGDIKHQTFNKNAQNIVEALRQNILKAAPEEKISNQKMCVLVKKAAEGVECATPQAKKDAVKTARSVALWSLKKLQNDPFVIHQREEEADRIECYKALAEGRKPNLKNPALAALLPAVDFNGLMPTTTPAPAQRPRLLVQVVQGLRKLA